MSESDSPRSTTPAVEGGSPIMDELDLNVDDFQNNISPDIEDELRSESTLDITFIGDHNEVRTLEVFYSDSGAAFMDVTPPPSFFEFYIRTFPEKPKPKPFGQFKHKRGNPLRIIDMLRYNQKLLVGWHDEIIKMAGISHYKMSTVRGFNRTFYVDTNAELPLKEMAVMNRRLVDTVPELLLNLYERMGSHFRDIMICGWILLSLDEIVSNPYNSRNSRTVLIGFRDLGLEFYGILYVPEKNKVIVTVGEGYSELLTSCNGYVYRCMEEYASSNDKLLELEDVLKMDNFSENLPLVSL